MGKEDIKVRPVVLEDAETICGIYNFYVEHTAITFETIAVEVAEMKGRIEEVLAAGLPYLVAEKENRVVGYCYIHKWKNRCAYASTKELTVYLDKAYMQQGVGTLLFEHLLKAVDLKDTHVLVSGICLPNEGSVSLHEKFGFKKVSHMKQVGWKFDRWRDVGHWELILYRSPSILVICTGNSCRSQMAHGFLQSFDPDIEVASAGTEPTSEVNPMAVKVMAEAGVDISNHVPENITKYLDRKWDYVITVCDGANEKCPVFTGFVKHRIHIGFDDPSKVVGSPLFIENEFHRVRDEIKEKFYQFYLSEIVG
jgi:thioredoxin type arsenate reductase